ncbi:MAG: hypothetical protein K8S00_14135 [Bacteroidales bacterium]|nr:hypothetical protein [Bacteroidales bacterium]
MRKAIKLLTILSIILVLGFFMPACNCGVSEDEAAGAIGKVDKYHKDQMSESDLLLRSEIMEDTAALRNTMRGMLLVYVYYDAYGKSMKKNAEMLKNNPANVDDQLGAEDLEDYCEFIENGNEQLCEVCQMCSDVYNDTVTEYSFDVEQNVRNYAVYLDKLDSRDSLVSSAIEKSDVWIKENENDADKEKQVNQVKKIRDEILLRDICNGAVMDNQEKINTYSSKVIYNVADALASVFHVSSIEQLKDVIVPEGMQNIESAYIVRGIQNLEAELNQFNETGNLDHFVNSLKSVPLMSQQNLDAAGNVVQSQVAYDAAGNVVQSQQNLDAAGNVVQSQQNLDAAGNVVQSQQNLDAAGNIVQSHQYSNIVYTGFVFNDKNVIESFEVIRNMENMKDIVQRAFSNLDAAVNFESFAEMNSHELGQFMSNYVVQSSNINYNNVDNLSDVINPQ